MNTLELVKLLKAKVEKALLMEHSNVADNYFKGELGALLLIEDFIENGTIPDIITREDMKR